MIILTNLNSFVNNINLVYTLLQFFFTKQLRYLVVSCKNNNQLRKSLKTFEGTRMNRASSLFAKLLSVPWQVWYYISLVFGVLAGLLLGFAITAFIIDWHHFLISAILCAIFGGSLCNIMYRLLYSSHILVTKKWRKRYIWQVGEWSIRLISQS